jgi:hypothetical protein
MNRSSLRFRVSLLSLAFLVAVAGLSFAQMMGPGWGGYGGGPYGGGPWWWNTTPPANTPQLTIDQATAKVEEYLKASWSPDLKLAEVWEFDNQFYAEVREKSTGIGAFELLVNKWTGAIVPEPGPNMMWNTKYGHMGYGMIGGGMMGGPGWGWGGGPGWGWGWRGRGQYRNWANPSTQMPVTAEQAHRYAQQFLDANFPGTTLEKDADVFYGYYTITVLKDGKIYGMLGVNGYNGWVWYHTWHGKFIQMKEVE